MKQNVLIVGSGGREHALAWKLCQSPRVGQVYVAPGNAGTKQVAVNVPITATAIHELAEFAKQQRIDLTVVGPDDALAGGIVDVFQERKLRIFGPSQAAAQIESSKVFAKQLMTASGVPTAAYRVFRQFREAVAYVRGQAKPVVVKANGLARGKGVYLCRTIVDAETALLRLMVQRVHGAAGDEVVVEDFLLGRELSIHAISGGRNSVLFPPAQDYKKARDGDEGENTGGMGCVAPLPWVDPHLLAQVRAQVVSPMLEAMSDQGIGFSGCLYPGLMITAEGIKTLEFNARFGDPETQVYMRLLKSDLLELLNAGVDGELTQVAPQWRPGFAVCVVMTSAGYPDGKIKTNVLIDGLERASKVPGVVVFHAGTKGTNRVRTAGGRVLAVTAVGDTLPKAVDRAYQGVDQISFNGMRYRRDIGAKILPGS